MKVRADCFKDVYFVVLAGQKISKVLSRNIDSKVASIRKIVREYNRRIAFKLKIMPEDVQCIRYEDAIDLESEIYQDLPNSIADDVPKDVKRRAVELYVANKRAKEEVILCKEDMGNTLHSLNAERKKVSLTIDMLKGRGSVSNYILGAISLLKDKLLELDNLIKCYSDLFLESNGISSEQLDALSSQEVALQHTPHMIDRFQLGILTDEDYDSDDNAPQAVLEVNSETPTSDNDQGEFEFSLFLPEDSS